MIILGIDPGIATLGYGLINYEGNKFKVIKYGAIITSPKDTTPKRLSIIYDELNELISKYNIDAIAVEELFFNKNVKTALIVGHARGIILLSAYKANLNIYEYTPLQIKQAVVGYGRAEKQQIQQMTKIFLNLNEVPKPDDVADALAVAICHAHSSNSADLFKIK